MPRGEGGIEAPLFACQTHFLLFAAGGGGVRWRRGKEKEEAVLLRVHLLSRDVLRMREEKGNGSRCGEETRMAE